MFTLEIPCSFLEGCKEMLFIAFTHGEILRVGLFFGIKCNSPNDGVYHT